MPGYRIYNQYAPHFVTFTVIDWIDVFTRPEYKQIIIDSLLYCREHKSLQIHAWCLMTNHLHMIISAGGEMSLSEIIRDFKRHTAKKILYDMEKNYTESRRKWMLWMFRKKGTSSINNEIYQFWTHHNRPKEIYSSRFFHQKANYIHYNPVKAGFCISPLHYPFSSALWYECREGLIEMDELVL